MQALHGCYANPTRPRPGFHCAGSFARQRPIPAIRIWKDCHTLLQFAHQSIAPDSLANPHHHLERFAAFHLAIALSRLSIRDPNAALAISALPLCCSASLPTRFVSTSKPYQPLPPLSILSNRIAGMQSTHAETMFVFREAEHSIRSTPPNTT